MNKGESADPAPVLDQLRAGSRVAVIRIRSLGDSVLATPAVHLLKLSRPDVQIAVVSEPRFAAIWEGNGDVEEVLPPSLRALREFGSDLCLNLHGGTTSARLTMLSGARFRAGFEHFRFPRAYNVRIPKAQETLGVDRKVHTAEHAASAMFAMGVSFTEIPRARLFAKPQAAAGPRPYAVIHAVASEPAKTWPAPFFVNIAQHLQRELGLEPVFIAGPGEDMSPFQKWRALAGASLDQVKALLAGAALFVGNDSGPAHMAAAFGLPAVVIFGPSDPVVWAPWKTPSKVLVSDGAIENVTPATVVEAVERLWVHV